MKKVLIFFGLLGVGIYLLVQLIFNTGVDNMVDTLLHFNIYHFAVLCLLTAINFILYAIRYRVVLNHFEPENKVSFWTLYMMRTSAFAIGYLTPFLQVGGEPVRVYFLHKDGVKTKNGIATVVVDKMMESAAFIALSVIGVAIGFYMGFLDKETSQVLWYTLIAAVIFLLALFYAIFFKSGFISKLIRILHLTKFERVQKFERKVAEIEDLMSDFCTGHYWRFFLLMLISAANVLIYVLEHFALAYFLGVVLSPLQSFLVTAIPNAAYLLPIPGALGALESFHVAMFALLGININAVALVLVLRVRDILLIGIGIVYASGHGLNMLKEAFSNKQSSKTLP